MKLSDRHPGLLRSVPKIFGEKNHAYCYHHLKENFSSYFNKHNTKGNKGKENALEWLDKIVYARVEIDYNYHILNCESITNHWLHGLSKMNLSIGTCRNSPRKDGTK